MEITTNECFELKVNGTLYKLKKYSAVDSAELTEKLKKIESDDEIKKVIDVHKESIMKAGLPESICDQLTFSQYTEISKELIGRKKDEASIG